jgi:ABC-type Fe3+-hydroxamate transport system substrate-binding protein
LVAGTPGFLEPVISDKRNVTTLAALRNLAELQKVKGKYKEAKELFHRMLSITEQAHEDDPDHSDIATAAVALGGTLRNYCNTRLLKVITLHRILSLLWEVLLR